MEKCFAGSASGANTETLSIAGNIVEVVVMVDTRPIECPMVVLRSSSTSSVQRTSSIVKGDRCEQFARFLKSRTRTSTKH
jgi:hypothetical protein